MKPKTPTWRQRLLATDRLVFIWMYTVAAATTVVTLISIGHWRYVFGGVWQICLLVFACLLSFITGFFVSIPTGWFVLGPIYFDQGLRNGGPFEPGDIVQVIAGPYRDQVTEVYSLWQQETLRVDLGEEAKANYQDIFTSSQLLLIKKGQQPSAEE